MFDNFAMTEKLPSETQTAEFHTTSISECLKTKNKTLKTDSKILFLICFVWEEIKIIENICTVLEFQESTLKHRQHVDFIRIRSIVMEMDIIANAMKGRL